MKDSDIIITSDVDAFPMTNEMIAPIIRFPTRSIWLYRYGITAFSGTTFMMAFIGAKVEVWRYILQYDYNPEIHSDIGQGLHDWVKKYAYYFMKGTVNTNAVTENNTVTTITKSTNNSYTWEIDQLLISRAILASGLCSLPFNNSLWQKVNLENKTHK